MEALRVRSAQARGHGCDSDLATSTEQSHEEGIYVSLEIGWYGVLILPQQGQGYDAYDLV